jgi:hypothetical protein
MKNKGRRLKYDRTSLRNENNSEDQNDSRQARNVILAGTPCKTACKGAYENDKADKKGDSAPCEGFHDHITHYV